MGILFHSPTTSMALCVRVRVRARACVCCMNLNDHIRGCCCLWWKCRCGCGMCVCCMNLTDHIRVQLLVVQVWVWHVGSFSCCPLQDFNSNTLVTDLRPIVAASCKPLKPQTIHVEGEIPGFPLYEPMIKSCNCIVWFDIVIFKIDINCVVWFDIVIFKICINTVVWFDIVIFKISINTVVWFDIVIFRIDTAIV